jgi:hypothetical protein
MEDITEEVKMVDDNINNIDLNPPPVQPVVAPKPTPSSGTFIFGKSNSGLKKRPVMMEYKESKSSWQSVNDSLCNNQCWLCKDTFKRGKIKKVFTFKDLLQYLYERFVKENAICSQESLSSSITPSIIVDQNSNSTEEKSIEIPTIVILPLLSTNLISVYNRFRELKGDTEVIQADIKKYDIELWMSGLVCCSNEECSNEYKYLCPEYTTTTHIFKTKNNKYATDGLDCPPGCGCDNPWPFLG